MRKALGEPASAVPTTREQGLSSSAWWLRSVTGSNGEGVEHVESAFPWMASGRTAEASRATEGVTPYDGHVPEAGPVLDPASPAIVYSVTELEKAAECPFRFFLKRGLGLRPVDERERDRDVWLDPLTRGSALHDVYAAFLRKVRDEQRRPAKRDESWLLEYARRYLVDLHTEMPAPTDEVLRRETDAFLADVSLFLDAEIEDEARRAIGLEVSFGRPLGDDEEAMASAEPAVVTLGDGITLRFAGRVDRVNEVGPATFEVLDYKTGSYFRDEWKGTFNGGRRLQHALYGLAVAALLRETRGKVRIHGGSYYFSSTKGGGNRVDIPAPSLGSIAAVLADLREVITAGAFLRTPDNDRCTFCDFDALCGAQTNEQAKAKRGDAQAAAFVRLATHA